jgi:hypothetical protein
LAPNEKFSYAGIEAPPSAAGALAKGLQLGMSGYLQGRGMRSSEDLANKMTTERKADMDKVVAALQGTPGAAEVPGSVTATQADVNDREMGPAAANPIALGQQLATGGGMGEGANIGAPAKAAVSGSLDAAQSMMMSSKFPDLQAAGLSGMAARQAAKDARLLTLQDAETKAQTAKDLKKEPGWQAPRQAVPGIDTPLSPEVQRQRVEEAGARAEAARETPEVAAARAAAIADANPTQDQRLAAGFADRMQNANLEFDDLSKKGYDPTNFADRVAADKLPTVIANFMTSPEGQRWRTAQENWVRANLRKESGAVIGPDEMKKEVENYFPSPGATPAAIAQKTQLRSQLTENMKLAGAGAYKAIVKTRAATAPTGLSPDDQAAFNWAKANVEDPRSSMIMQRLGTR